ncbi:Clp protease N-terminal domain-containing protein [Actinoplanes sp. NPDC023801]|uniref:Clp protease N-terminal domain-containing protein n=1 Tax=Actinoplanes sp. NPDC023801 TaxID=3154595 RepID=UPI0033F301A3
MAVTFTGDDRFPAVLATARAAARDELGTVHLLAGMAGAAPDVAALLDTYDITPAVLRAVLRDRVIGDGPAPPVAAVVRGHATLPLTAGVRAALVRCAAYHAGTRTSRQLLATILDDPGTGAVTLLRFCGADVEAVRRALRTGQTPVRAERLPAPLRPVRDRLIGRQRYRGRGLRDLLRPVITRVPVDYAAAPVRWASAEATEAAGHAGRVARTDDVLLAMVTTFQVAEAYPHLASEVAELYDGTRRLLTGVGPEALATAVAAERGDDEVPLKSLLKAGMGAPRDTAGLLRALTAHPGTRAARVLRSLGADPRVPACALVRTGEAA